MHEPNLRSSRLAIAGGLVAVIGIAAAGFLLGRGSVPDTTPPPPAHPMPMVVPEPPKVEAPRILGRADLIAMGDRAADALTSGATLPPNVAAAAGRRFEVVLPFGCGGPVPEESAAPQRWSYDADKQTLRIHVAPTRWRADDWGLSQPGANETSFEGFWVNRPWSSAERCPRVTGQAAALGSQPVTLPGQTLAMAEVLPQGDRRDDRRFETVQRIAPAQLSAVPGFRLRLSGRVERLPNGRPVQCTQPAGIEQRPICMVVVSFDEIRIENPLDDSVLATWSIRPPIRPSS